MSMNAEKTLITPLLAVKQLVPRVPRKWINRYTPGRAIALALAIAIPLLLFSHRVYTELAASHEMMVKERQAKERQEKIQADLKAEAAAKANQQARIQARVAEMVANPHFSNSDLDEKFKAFKTSSQACAQYANQLAAGNDFDAIAKLLNGDDDAYQELYNKNFELRKEVIALVGKLTSPEEKAVAEELPNIISNQVAEAHDSALQKWKALNAGSNLRAANPTPTATPGQLDRVQPNSDATLRPQAQATPQDAKTLAAEMVDNPNFSGAAINKGLWDQVQATPQSTPASAPVLTATANASATTVSTDSKAQEAEQLIRSYFAARTGGADVSGLLGDYIRVDGKQESKADFYKIEIQPFLEHWRTHVYNIEQFSVSPKDNGYAVTTIVRWQVANGGKQKSGRSQLDFQLVGSPLGIVSISESRR
jgi:hypothetical protein